MKKYLSFFLLAVFAITFAACDLSNSPTMEGVKIIDRLEQMIELASKVTHQDGEQWGKDHHLYTQCEYWMKDKKAAHLMLTEVDELKRGFRNTPLTDREINTLGTPIHYHCGSEYNGNTLYSSAEITQFFNTQEAWQEQTIEWLHLLEAYFQTKHPVLGANPTVEAWWTPYSLSNNEDQASVEEFLQSINWDKTEGSQLYFHFLEWHVSFSTYADHDADFYYTTVGVFAKRHPYTAFKIYEDTYWERHEEVPYDAFPELDYDRSKIIADSAEWRYLFYERPNADRLWFRCHVRDQVGVHNGIMLLADGMGDGIYWREATKRGSASRYEDYSVNWPDVFGGNEGGIFIPAYGYKKANGSIVETNDAGYYRTNSYFYDEARMPSAFSEALPSYPAVLRFTNEEDPYFVPWKGDDKTLDDEFSLIYFANTYREPLIK